MANVLTPPELHDKNSRSGFDLSNKVLFTSKFGEILPVKYWETLPGDKFKIKLNSFIRTADMSSVNFTRMRQYYNFYFVPYRLLWRDFPSFIVNRPDTAKQASSINSAQQVSDVVPYFECSELCPLFSHNAPVNSQLTKSGDVSVDINPRTIGDNVYPFFELDSSSHPTSDPSLRFNPFGFLRLQGTFKLLQYLGYNSVISYYDGSTTELLPHSVNAFPLLAYQKIYQDYFRNSQWEKENPSAYNVDYLRENPKIPVTSLFDSSSSQLRFRSIEESMFDLRYSNYNKDLFNGVLPSSQFGSKAIVKVTSPEELKGVEFGLGMSLFDPPTNATEGSAQFLGLKTNAVGGSGNLYTSGNFGYIGSNNLVNPVHTSLGTVQSPISETIDKLNLSFSILQLRIAEAQQRFAEISATNDANYKAQIEAHFGVKVSSLMSSLCDYLGGIGFDINQNVVQNTNLAESSAVNLGSYGTAGGDKFIEFESKEHGIIMCLSYAVPQLEYIPYGTSFLPLKLSYTDWAIPEYDSLGLEAVTQETLINPDSTTADFFMTPLGRANLGIGNFTDNVDSPVPLVGYTTRYYDYKTDYDVCYGDFHVPFGRSFTIKGNSFNGTLSDWSLRLNPDNYPLMYTASYGRSLSKFQLGDLSKYKVPCRFVANFPSHWLFKVNPHVVDSIFIPQAGQTVKSDVLRHAVFFDTKVVRNLSRSGLPY